MRAEGTFRVESFVPTEVGTDAGIVTARPVGVATMSKVYAGHVEGRSATVFTAAYDQALGAGTYVAAESFEGTVNGATGTFNFVHSATTTGTDRTDEFFLVVPGSGTGGLAGIRGDGGLAVDADGTHRIWLDVEFD